MKPKALLILQVMLGGLAESWNRRFPAKAFQAAVSGSVMASSRGQGLITG
jgi:hypothetical protein